MATLSIPIDIRNLDIVKNTITIISNDIHSSNGFVNKHNENLLVALLGENWAEDYDIGTKYRD